MQTNYQEKKKNLIRLEAVAPFGVVIGVVFLYFVFLFDFQLRKTLEWAGGFINGAEVNITGIKTRFLRASFQMDTLQVTDPSSPERNRLQVGKIAFRLNWDGLLRGRWITDEVEVTDVGIRIPRKIPGKVYPPGEEGSSLSYYTQKLWSEVQDQWGGEALARLSAIFGQYDPREKIKALGQLETLAAIEGLEKDLGEKEQAWKKTLAELPSQKDMDLIQTKIASLKVGGTNNPAEIQGQIKNITSVLDESRSKVSEVQGKTLSLAGQMSDYQKSLSRIETAMQKDRTKMESQLQIPSLDSGELARQLFGRKVMSHLGEVEKAKTLSRQYLAQGDEERAVAPKIDDKPVVRRRGGKNYEFGRRPEYPGFWIKRVVISSVGENRDLYGQFSGKILDICSNPRLLGRPLEIDVRGEMPSRQLGGLYLYGLIDHTRPDGREKFELRVGSFPVTGESISESETFKLRIAEAQGTASAQVQLVGDQVILELSSALRKPKFTMEAQSAPLRTLMSAVLDRLTELTLRAKVWGTWSNLQVALQSNLASAIQDGLRSQLAGKIAEARKIVDQKLEEQVGGRRKKLQHQAAAVSAQIQSQADVRKKQAETLVASAQSKLEQAKKQASRPAQQAVQKLKKLF